MLLGTSKLDDAAAVVSTFAVPAQGLEICGPEHSSCCLGFRV